MSAEWNANMLQAPTTNRPATWFDDEGDALGDELPWLIIRQATMGEGGLRPTSKSKAKTAVFIAEVGGRRFDYLTGEPCF